jgi:hypothetical protein
MLFSQCLGDYSVNYGWTAEDLTQRGLQNTGNNFLMSGTPIVVDGPVRQDWADWGFYKADTQHVFGLNQGQLIHFGQLGATTNVERILAEATNVLRTNNGTDTIFPGGTTLTDVACDVRMKKFNGAAVLPILWPDSVINTMAELALLNGGGTTAKMVNIVAICTGNDLESPVTVGNIIGCGNLGSNGFIVERRTGNANNQTEGILWAHEYGHNKNLPHTTADPDGTPNSGDEFETRPLSVMRSTLTITSTHINNSECNSYKNN